MLSEFECVHMVQIQTLLYPGYIIEPVVSYKQYNNTHKVLHIIIRMYKPEKKWSLSTAFLLL